jgi:hypothetical protein
MGFSKFVIAVADAFAIARALLTNAPFLFDHYRMCADKRVTVRFVGATL